MTQPQPYGAPQSVPAPAPYGQPQQPAYPQQPQPAYQQPGYTPNAYASTPYQQPGAPQPGKGMAITSLVLGIVSIVFWFFFTPGGVICGIVGLILGIMAKSKGFSGGMQTGGLVTSIIGTALCAISLVACLACLGSVGVGLESLGSM